MRKMAVEDTSMACLSDINCCLTQHIAYWYLTVLLLCLSAAGCIPNDYWDMGVAVGPLNVPAGLYFPARITIRGWSDGSSVSDVDG